MMSASTTIPTSSRAMTVSDTFTMAATAVSAAVKIQAAAHETATPAATKSRLPGCRDSIVAKSASVFSADSGQSSVPWDGEG
jgi:hypothetical protein